MDFYTNIFLNKGRIYAKGVKAGKPHKEIYSYSPYLFVPASTETQFKTLDGKYVEKKNFNTMYDARQFIKQYEDVGGFSIYGLSTFQYAFIYDNFQGTINYEPENISVVGIDIENAMTRRVDIATSVTTVPNEITCVTLRKGNMRYVFGVKDFEETNENVVYYRCKSEREMLIKIIEIWKYLDPDVITGWNCEFYDIPYLVNRIIRVLGEKFAKELSPWGKLNQYEVYIKGKPCPSFRIEGIAVLDYMQLYKKFIYTPRESYRLDFICQEELGEKKIDYSEYGNLDDLYAKDPQKYVAYNIHDVDLVFKLEEKLKLIDLVFALAYDAKVNYQDTLASVRQWDIMIHNYLMDQGYVIPMKNEPGFNAPLVGGYVKAPQTGLHKWVISFDLNSLYPHLIMQYNISPEKFRGKMSGFPSIDDLLERKVNLDDQYSYCANGCFYDKSEQGFLAALMQKMYNDRKVYKKQMISAQQKLQITSDKKERWELEKIISKLNNLQMAKKIQLNSAYGALGNRYFRWYDINHAEAITMSGQLSIRWIADRLNEYFNKLLGTENADYVIASDTDSVVGESVINVNGVDMTIEDYYNLKEDIFLKCDKFNHNYVKLCENDTTPSVSKEGKLETKSINYVMKHKVKKRMFRITNNDGKSVVVTEDHSIIARNVNTKKISSIKPHKLNPKIHSIINIIGTDKDSMITDEENNKKI